MPPRPDLVAERDPDAEAALKRSERAVCDGAGALAERNDLLAALFASGYTQRELTDILNGVRSQSGCSPLTEDAVYKAIKSRRRP